MSVTTARNLLIDKVRHERIVSIDFTQDFEALNVLIDEVTPERRLSARQELRRLANALDGLSNDCRAVLWMRRVEGLSQREAARREPVAGEHRPGPGACHLRKKEKGTAA